MNRKIAVLTVLSFVFLLRTQVFSSPLDEELQKLKQAGIPTTLEESTPPAIPDSENAALVYQKAFDLMEKNREDMEKIKSLSSYSDVSKWTEEQKREISSVIEKNKGIFSLLKKAASMPKCRFPIAYEKLSEGNQLGHLSKLITCARFLSAKAAVEVEKRETEKALNTCLVNLAVARSLSNEPFYISQFARIFAIEKEIVIPSIETILNKGNVGPAPYKKLLEAVLEERKCNVTSLLLRGSPFYITSRFEQFRKNPAAGASMFVTYNDANEQRKVEKVVKKYRPFAESDEVLCLRTLSEMISLAEQPYWQIRDRLLTMNRDIQYILPEKKNFITKITLQPYFRFYDYEASSDALLGAAELGLANRIYRQKYGKFADSLNQLTSEIIPSLPLDPFTGKDYIYRKKDKGFIVYSVADNLKDNGGIPQFSEQGKKGDFDIVWEDNGAGNSNLTMGNVIFAQEQNPMSIDKVIAGIKYNESLLKDWKLSCFETIKDHQGQPSSEEESIWAQKGTKLYRLKKETGQDAPKNILAFDGEKLTVWGNNKKALIKVPNETDFRGIFSTVSPLHLFQILRYREKSISDILEKEKENVTASLSEKTEDINGHPCYLLQITWRGKEIDDCPLKYKLWIDYLRGFRPIKMIETVEDSHGKTLLKDVIETEYKEFNGNIWFPTRGHAEGWVYDNKGGVRAHAISEFRLENIEINKQIPDAFFQKIAFPSGTRVYDEKAVNHYTVP